jgi:signal transduction histidine kinase
MTNAPLPDELLGHAAALRRGATVAGAIVILAGSLVLLGWAADIELLKSMVPGFIVTLPLAAVGFILGGSSLFLLAAFRAGERALLAARALAGLVLLLGVLMLVQRLGGLELSFSQWLFANALRAYPYRPLGVIAANSGVSFTLLGASLLALSSRLHGRERVADTLAVPALLIAAAALIGYLYGVRAMYSIDRYAGMALPTAIAFSLLGSGVVLANGNRGVLGLVVGADAGAVLARRLLFAAILVPVGLGWLWLVGRRSAWFSRETGVALFVVLTSASFVAVVLRSALAVRRTDRERERARQDAEVARISAETAQHRAEEAQQRAEAANLAKSDFLAMMSHELRTPLNAIRGYAQLLALGVRGPVTDAQRADLARIGQSERHLLGLIEDLLNFTRIERGHLEYDLRPVAVVQALDDVLILIAPQMRAKGIEYKVSPVDPAIAVRADDVRLQQILLNLLSNAVKFGAPGGHVAVTCAHDEHNVRIHVEDNGRGIPPDKLEAIFDPFVQVDGGLTRTATGIGLGLAISRQLARAMHGDLTAESKLGIGATFILCLPRVESSTNVEARRPVARLSS